MRSRRRAVEDVFARLLRSHGTSKNLPAGMLLHDELVRGGDTSLLLSNLIIQMYGDCGCVQSARSVFNHMPRHNIFSWNLMIGAYVRHGSVSASMDFFQHMCLECCPDEVSFATTISACIQHRSGSSLIHGMWLHRLVLCYGFECSVTVATALVSMYGKCSDNFYTCGNHDCDCVSIQFGRINGKCGRLGHAQWTFDTMRDRNVFTWNSMLAIYGQHQDLGKESLQAFYQMLRESLIPDKITYVTVLSTCARLKLLDVGKRVYASTFGSPFMMDISLQNAALNMYSRCGNLDGAYKIFHSISEKNLITWNVMIMTWNAHFQHMSLFTHMQLEGILPDEVTYSSALTVLCGEQHYPEGRCMHARIIGCPYVLDIVVETAIITMYSKCGHIDEARMMFDALDGRHIGIWNAMITGYTQHRSIKEAFLLFYELHAENISPNNVTFVTLLSICADEVDLNLGVLMHDQIISHGIILSLEIGNSLVDMYGKCGALEDALSVFSSMAHHNLVSWSSLIASYIHHALDKEALHLFERMLVDGVVPDKLIFLFMLPSCAAEAGLMKSRNIHHYIANHDFEMDSCVRVALINMYSKCGSLEDARVMFDRITSPSLMAWNSIMSAYAHYGQVIDVIRLLDKMTSDVFIPDDCTLHSILSAFSHTGMVDQGYMYFLYMHSLYNIMPSVEHFNCLIDLFGRAGQVYEIECLINNLPYQPTGASWMTFVSSCQLHTFTSNY